MKEINTREVVCTAFLLKGKTTGLPEFYFFGAPPPPKSLCSRRGLVCLQPGSLRRPVFAKWPVCCRQLGPEDFWRLGPRRASFTVDKLYKNREIDLFGRDELDPVFPDQTVALQAMGGWHPRARWRVPEPYSRQRISVRWRYFSVPCWISTTGVCLIPCLINAYLP